MHEIELKFQVPAGRRSALEAAVAGRLRPARVRLQAAYFDTADRALAAAGMALRLRREGRRWVQTLKGASADAMTRIEHNVPRGASAPPIDPTLHRGTPIGDALLSLLAARPPEALTMRWRTDILRRSRVLRGPRGRVELALDAGRIEAGGGTVALLELEIELHGGSPLAVTDAARRWLPRFGLWLDTRSKAERGDMLARAEAMAAPRGADPVGLMPAMNGPAAWQTVLRSCTRQITVNASQIASGAHAAEHVHQLRIGLRRLRSAVRLFDGEGADAALGMAAAALFRRLGGARDQVLFESVLAAELLAALRAAGIASETDEPGRVTWLPAGATEQPVDVLRDRPTQLFLLDLIAAAQPRADTDPRAADAALRTRLARRLNRWHRQVLADAARFAELDDAARHRLRKRVKRLRYGAEFAGAVFERHALRRYLAALGRVQAGLGGLNDVVVALAAFARADAADPRNGFAMTWLSVRRATVLREAARDLKTFRTIERFWRRA